MHILAIALLLTPLAVVERAEAHGCYVGPTETTYRFLECCGKSRTSTETTVREQYYYWPLDDGTCFGSIHEDSDVGPDEQNWGYHWHSRSSIDCVDRNHGGYETECDKHRRVCNDEKEISETPYATCQTDPEEDEQCHESASSADVYDYVVIYGDAWWDVKEKVWYAYDDYHEVTIKRKCKRELIP